MDILKNRLGINNKVKNRSSFAEFYNLKKDIKSNSVAIENSVIANSINELISHKRSPRGEDGDERKGLLRKTKDGVVNIINKIIAFFKRVKDYVVKKFRQFKEFIFGKKADKVQKATDAATTVINEVIKKNGNVPTNMPNNAWDYIKKQMGDTDKSGQDVADEFVKKAFGSKGTVKVDSIEIPRMLVTSDYDFFIEQDVSDEILDVVNYLSMLRYDELKKKGALGNITRGIDIDKFGQDQLKDLSKRIGSAWAEVIAKFNGYTLAFSKNMELVSVPVTDRERLKNVTKKINEIKENIFIIKNTFSDINDKLVKYYDSTMKKMEELKKELSGDADFNELYRDIIDINNILTGSNDKLLKEADQLIKSYDKVLNNITVKIK